SSAGDSMLSAPTCSVTLRSRAFACSSITSATATILSGETVMSLTTGSPGTSGTAGAAPGTPWSLSHPQNPHGDFAGCPDTAHPLLRAVVSQLLSAGYQPPSDRGLKFEQQKVPFTARFGREARTALLRTPARYADSVGRAGSGTDSSPRTARAAMSER